MDLDKLIEHWQEILMPIIGLGLGAFIMVVMLNAI